jgi:hypothetical protein
VGLAPTFRPASLAQASRASVKSIPIAESHAAAPGDLAF